MRTTLTVDDRALAAARSRARQLGISVGQALSELAIMGYEAESADLAGSEGFPMLPGVEGHVITTEMLDDAMGDE